MNTNKTAHNGIFKRIEGSRIVYYRINSPIEAEFWDNHWKTNTSPEPKVFFRRYLKGYLGYGQLRHVFLKYLPRNGLILEAGCGMGQYVAALRSRGYNCIGVDFAKKTIESVKNYLPDLPVNKDDILQLDFEDQSIDSYISLGVIEHFKDGPYKALKEAYRVLKENGLLIVSIPQAFAWRKRSAYPENKPLPHNASFYQYAFSADEFREIVFNAGFSVIAEYGYSSHYALRLRFNFFRKLLRLFPHISLIDLILDRTKFGINHSRMRLYVAKKM